MSELTRTFKQWWHEDGGRLPHDATKREVAVLAWSAAMESIAAPSAPAHSGVTVWDCTPPSAPVEKHQAANKLVQKARELYSEERSANIAYISRASSAHVRQFIQELASALEWAESDFMEVHRNCIEAREELALLKAAPQSGGSQPADESTERGKGHSSVPPSEPPISAVSVVAAPSAPAGEGADLIALKQAIDEIYDCTGSALLSGDRHGKDDKQIIYSKLCKVGSYLTGLMETLSQRAALASPDASLTWAQGMEEAAEIVMQQMIRHQDTSDNIRKDIAAAIRAKINAGKEKP